MTGKNAVLTKSGLPSSTVDLFSVNGKHCRRSVRVAERRQLRNDLG